MAALALVGVLGTADDWLNARTGDGISATQKLLWQSVVAGVAAWRIQDTYQITALFAPFIGVISIPPWLYILFAASPSWLPATASTSPMGSTAWRAGR